ncbi:MAG: 5'-methylthioadenosine nucleosidase [Phycisphaerales bacterium]
MPSTRVDLVILTAMETESRPIIEALGLEECAPLAPPLPFAAFEGAGVALATPGRDARWGVDNIGTQAAAMLTDVALRRYSPRLTLNAGVVGAFASQGAHVGELLNPTEAIFHDRRIDLPGFREYGVGGYPCVDLAAPPWGPVVGFDLRTGVVSSGDALDALDSELTLMRERGVVAKDMEAASMAWVCALHGAPFASVKCVTDFIDEPSKTTEHFLANLAVACDRLGAFVGAFASSFAGEG